MHIRAMSLSSLDIPFKVAFRHASASRDRTQTAWVVTHSDTAVGYGESCPRSYVTGEDMGSVQRFFDSHRDDVIEAITDLDSLMNWVSVHEQEINQDPAAWCAMELALLDCLGKEAGCCIEALLGLPPLQGDYAYTAVLGDSPLDAYTRQVQQYASLGFKDYKIKITDDVASNKAKIELIHERVPGARIRLDANNLWTDAELAIAHLSDLPGPVFAIEEPLAAGDIAGMSVIARDTGCKIILDESFTNTLHFQSLLQDPGNWIINLRVSKLGGLLRAIACAQLAKEHGIACIVGAQVGETSLLTRAGLTLAQACQSNLVGQEGAFGLHLLEEDVCDKPLMFGQHGKLSVDHFPGMQSPGFGFSLKTRFEAPL